MRRKASILTAEGFAKSYVDINEVLPKSSANPVLTVDDISELDTSILKPGQLIYDTENSILYVIDPSGENNLMKVNEEIVAIENLSSTGVSGKLYYNYTDGKYYVWSDDENNYIQLGSSDMPYVDYSEVVEPNIYNGTTINSNSLSIPIEPNKYYDFGVRPIAVPLVYGLGVLPIKLDPNVAYQYCGRFTVANNAETDNFVFQLVNKRVGGTGTFPMVIQDNMGNSNMPLHIGGSVPEFEAGHTYEFTIVYDTCIFLDITPPQETTNESPGNR